MDGFVTVLREAAVKADAVLTTLFSVRAQIIAMLLLAGSTLFFLAKIQNDQGVVLRLVARLRALLGAKLGAMVFGRYAESEPWPPVKVAGFRMATGKKQAPDENARAQELGAASDLPGPGAPALDAPEADENDTDRARRLAIDPRQLAVFEAALERQEEPAADAEAELRAMAAHAAQIGGAIERFSAGLLTDEKGVREGPEALLALLGGGQFQDLAATLAQKRPGLIDENGALRPESESQAVFYAAAFAALGDLMMRMREYENAISAFRQALDATSVHDLMERAKFLHKYANAAYRAGELETAKQAFFDELNILELERGAAHPDVATAFNNLGLLHYESGEMDAAERLLKKAVDAKVKNGDLASARESRENLAQVLRAMGRAEEAARALAQGDEPADVPSDK
ncbi:tetratricopeptide repeat protein [Varunaivibrio sulfuroxidans]|uniref:Tetratricopeptide repeat protein n=1 Tax=Varunaivibrio sulfuroxidans TaxID=1773489 RepID=A0A4V2UP98_9PROT|nr:tetratricopeptide repeat protein [Varunaivibrio sulfuroxidans]TCS65151.1 tetratricopeptide repeat protein [Varunaivibrio sulfuroxidans]WES29565.1 tetratricopeptide repeat protein [Varunaivibrio sulfuroxidans]